MVRPAEVQVTKGRGGDGSAPARDLSPIKGVRPDSKGAIGSVRKPTTTRPGIAPVSPLAPDSIKTPAVSVPQSKPSHATATGGHQDGLFAAGIYASSGGVALGFSYVDDGYHGHHGCAPYAYPYSWTPYWSSCYAPVGYYSPHFYSPYVYSSPWGHGFGSPWWSYSYCGTGWYGSSYWTSGWRLSVGFGYACSPWNSYRWSYPSYRRYGYYPYSYYNTVVYYPAYTSVYHTDTVVVDYEDSYDPYVDYVDEVAPRSEPVVRVSELRSVPVSSAGVGGLFTTPIVADFPSELGPSEALARGEGWLRSGDFLLAAESFRRAWLATPDDYYAPLQLGLSLFAAQGRVSLAKAAISSGLARNPAWVERTVDLRESIGSKAHEQAASELERLVVSNPGDHDARFLLAYARLYSGQAFAAHSGFSTLESVGYADPSLAALKARAATELLRGSGAPK